MPIIWCPARVTSTSLTSFSCSARRCSSGTSPKASASDLHGLREDLRRVLAVVADARVPPLGVEVGLDVVEQRVELRRLGRSCRARVPSRRRSSPCRPRTRSRTAAMIVRDLRPASARPDRARRAGRRVPVAEARRERVGVAVAVGREPLRQPRRQVVLHRPGRSAREVLAVAVAQVGLPRDRRTSRRPRSGSPCALAGLNAGPPRSRSWPCRARAACTSPVARWSSTMSCSDLEYVALGVELQRRGRRRQLRVARPAVLLVRRRVGDDAADVVLGDRRDACCGRSGSAGRSTC